jgi:serine protease Do
MLKKNVDQYNEVSPEDVLDVTTKTKPNKGSRFKKLLFIFTVLSFCTLAFFGTTSFLWLGGYVDNWICTSVQEDSKIWNKFSCSTQSISESTTGETYEFNEKDEKNVIVSDLEEVVTKVVADSSASVVGIGVYGRNVVADQVVGSGFVVSANGLIVTNQHVVSSGDVQDFFVIIGEDTDPIKVDQIYRDELNDIALLKVSKTELKTIPLGDSSTLKVGQTVIAIGNPLGSLSNTVTVGTVSALNREVDVSDDAFNFASRTHFDVIQTDAAINPGNSGGPLINSNGEVIGVNFATISGADNLSFALPINWVKQRIQELNEFGSFRIPFMGVEYQRRLVFYKNESIIGAVVMNVVAGSPAEKAGIVVGDVIVQYNNKDLENDSLLNLIQRSKIGDEVEVVLIRNNENVTIKVTISDRNEFGQ